MGFTCFKLSRDQNSEPTREGTFTDPLALQKDIITNTQNHLSGFLAAESSLSASFRAGAGERLCGEDWSKLRVKDLSCEIVSLVHDTLGIPLDDERVGFASQARDDIPLDWALGAFILKTEASTSQHAAASISHRDTNPCDSFGMFGIKVEETAAENNLRP